MNLIYKMLSYFKGEESIEFYESKIIKTTCCDDEIDLTEFQRNLLKDYVFSSIENGSDLIIFKYKYPFNNDSAIRFNLSIKFKNNMKYIEANSDCYDKSFIFVKLIKS